MSEYKSLLEKTMQCAGVKELNPLQKIAIKEEYLDENVIVESPTSSGKTFVAEFYSIYCAHIKKKRVVYLCPLKALAQEHYKSFKRKYEKEFDLKITISTGDLDSSAASLSNYNIIFMTYEKLDSVLRHKADWINLLGLLVVDELHMIDSDRGPTLESSIVQIRNSKEVQVLGLSATIPNSDELAKWLDAKLIKSDFRPVKLRKGVILKERIEFDDLSIKSVNIESGSIEGILKDTLEKKKQMIVFSNARKNAESTAKKLSSIVYAGLSEKEKSHLAKITDLDIENLTEFDKSILSLIRRGVAFHHAGIRLNVRELIEEEFKAGNIKLICSTPTLAAGINLPAYRVIIQSIYRHTEQGMKAIPVREYLQMSGRAGRFGYDSEGESILIAKDSTDKDFLFDRFVLAKSEVCESKLGYIPTLRMIMLGLISSNVIYDDKSLKTFFDRTYYATCFNNLELLNYNIYKVLQELIEYGFVQTKDKKITVTEIGARVAQLYIDPMSAYKIITKLNRLKENLDAKSTLMIIADTYELKPYFKVPKEFSDDLQNSLQSEYIDLGLEFDDLISDYELTDKYYTAKILEMWINEIPEDKLSEEYEIMPGILQTKINSAKWIAYSISEIAKVLQNRFAHNIGTKVEKRLEYGVKEDLIELVQIPNIGRVRARKLSNIGVRTIRDIEKSEPELIASTLGNKVAIKLLSHLKITHNIKGEESSQKTLFGYQ